MRSVLHTLDVKDISKTPAVDTAKHIQHLESGQVIYLPSLSFTLEKEEQHLLSPTLCDTKKKNISYHFQKQSLGGISAQHPYQTQVRDMMERYALFAKGLVDHLLAEYQSDLCWGRTSYRPIEITNRPQSKRQDDTRIHVDAFPATPVQGWRILRIFCNINPSDQPRNWHIGEPFEDVLDKFSTRLPAYSILKAKLLRTFKATKTLRTAYDHYMLQLHDHMKLDDDYQSKFEKTAVDFAANSTWIVFTDQVSHAALGGQFLLEQTFYLPIKAMLHPEYSPYQRLEQHGFKL